MIVVLAALSSGQACADSPVKALHGPTSSDALQGHIDYFIDPDWTLTPERVAGNDPPAFQPLGTRSPDFGYTSSRVWLRVKVRNEMAQQDEFLIYFTENFKQHFRVDVIAQDATIQRLLELEPNSPFSARPVPDPEMVAPLAIAPGQTVTILVSLWSEGSSHISFSIETPDSFAALSSKRTAKNFTFYGMMALLIGAALFALVLLRNWLFLAYSAYAGSALLYIMHVDGVAFQYLWPSVPSLNNKASIFAGAGIIVFGAIYSRMYLKTNRYHPHVDKVLLAVIFCTLGVIGAFYFTDPQFLKKSLVFMSLLAICIFASAGFIAARTRFNDVRFYLVAWAGAVVSASLLNLSHIFGVNISQDFVYDSIRATMVFDAAMMGLAIIDRYNQLRQSQRAALETRLLTVKRNLDLSKRLTRLTDSYSALETAARLRNEQIQNTVHDLRKPLYALKLKIANLIQDETGSHADAVEVGATVSYLEDLVADYLEQPSQVVGHGPQPPPDEPDLRQVIASVCEMFAPEARDKGIDLDYRCPPVRTSIRTLVIMRILSNLVCNAVNYTPSGHVFVDTQVDQDGIVITVADTGPGLTQDEFDHAVTRDIRLSDKSMEVDGSGIGLSIANDLAQDNGLQLDLLPRPGRGATIRLTLPR